MNKRYAFLTILDMDFDQAEAVLVDALKIEGFGVVGEIDFQQVFQTKLNKQTPKRKVFGICHPESAYQILAEEPEAGLLLPCTAEIYVHDGQVYVGLLNPVVVAELAEAKKVRQVAMEIHQRLKRVFLTIQNEGGEELV